MVDHTTLGMAGRAREELSAAAHRLERSLAAPRSDTWAKQVAEDLHELRSALTHHIELTEADNGLLSQIVEDAPRLVPDVEIIMADHTELCEAVDLALDIVDQSADRVHDVRSTVLDLLGRLYAHRQRGADLVFDAYNVDIGGLSGQ